MKFIILNIYAYGGSMLEQKLDNLLKEVAFGMKTSIKKQKYDYTYVLLPVVDSAEPSDEFQMFSNQLQLDLIGLSSDEKFALFKLFEMSAELVSTNKINVDIVSRLDDWDIGITYTDGSFKKATSQCSYACFQLLEKVIPDDYSESFALDDYTGDYYKFNSISGVVEEGTNNIGELSAVKAAAENFSDKYYQVIIADSEYSIKIFREYIHNWKNNGFKTYSGKSIANKELVQEIYSTINSKHKTVFFKWTKGHDKNSFNELCDKEAKEILGLK